jgi:hypothetical protein
MPSLRGNNFVTASEARQSRSPNLQSWIAALTLAMTGLLRYDRKDVGFVAVCYDGQLLYKPKERP